MADKSNSNQHSPIASTSALIDLSVDSTFEKLYQEQEKVWFRRKLRGKKKVNYGLFDQVPELSDDDQLVIISSDDDDHQQEWKPKRRRNTRIPLTSNETNHRPFLLSTKKAGGGNKSKPRKKNWAPKRSCREEERHSSSEDISFLSHQTVSPPPLAVRIPSSDDEDEDYTAESFFRRLSLFQPSPLEPANLERSLVPCPNPMDEVEAFGNQDVETLLASANNLSLVPYVDNAGGGDRHTNEMNVNWEETIRDEDGNVLCGPMDFADIPTNEPVYESNYLTPSKLLPKDPKTTMKAFHRWQSASSSVFGHHRHFKVPKLSHLF